MEQQDDQRDAKRPFLALRLLDDPSDSREEAGQKRKPEHNRPLATATERKPEGEEPRSAAGNCALPRRAGGADNQSAPRRRALYAPAGIVAPTTPGFWRSRQTHNARPERKGAQDRDPSKL